MTRGRATAWAMLFAILAAWVGLMVWVQTRDATNAAAGPVLVATTPEGARVYAIYVRNAPPYGWRYFTVSTDGTARPL